MTSSHTTSEAPPSYERMIEQARAWPAEGFGEGRWFNAMADWMEEARGLLRKCVTTGYSRHEINCFLAGQAPVTDEKDVG